MPVTFLDWLGFYSSKSEMEIVARGNVGLPQLVGLSRLLLFVNLVLFTVFCIPLLPVVF